MAHIKRYYYVLAQTIMITLFIIAPSTNAGITLDGTMGQSGTLSGPKYSITDTMGTLNGANLFHSFGEFNIFLGESATFTGPNYLQNIIARVTGGNSSTIDGLLSSAITGANLYFVNPAGIMFGESAHLDISGSFHASTADYLKLGDKGRFDASFPENSVLTSAAPSAFGFLGNNPAPINIAGSFLSVPKGKALSLIGGDMKIDNGSLYASEGAINVASVASKGEVAIDSKGISADGFDKLGNINITQTAKRVQKDGKTINNLDVSGEGGGTIYIRGGGFVVDGGVMTARTDGDVGGASIDIRLSGDLIVTNDGAIANNNNGAGSGKKIVVEAENMELTNGGGINSLCSGSGDGGGMILTIRNLLKIDGHSDNYTSGISLSSLGKGAAGDLSLSAAKMIVANDGGITGYGFDNGRASNISINVGNLKLESGGNVDNSVYGTGTGGDLSIEATDSIQISGSGNTRSGIYSMIEWGNGIGGNISIKAPRLSVVSSGIITGENGFESSGTGGDITLNVESLEIKDGGRIDVNTFGPGRGGRLTVTATDSVSITGAGGFGLCGLYAQAYGSGNGGFISVTAPRLALTNGGLVNGTTYYGSGNAGSIEMNLGSLEIAGGASGISCASLGKGKGGNISITAADWILMDGGSSTMFASSINTTSDSGNAGNITISTPSLTLKDNSTIFSSTMHGMGGNIILEVGALKMNGGEISTSSVYSGQAGDITISAADSITVTGNSSAVGASKYSQIDSLTLGTGDAGHIFIYSPVLTVGENGRIVASTEASGKVLPTGQGGSIDLQVGHLNLIDGGFLTTRTNGSGQGGVMTVNATESITISGSGSYGASGIYSTASSTGNAGVINVNTSSITITDGGKIDTSSAGTGKGGSINIDASSIDLKDNASISAKSTGAGDAGDITINSGDLLYSENSSITTAAEKAGGGVITINGNNVQLMNNSEITASVAHGESGGGNVTMNVNTLVAFDDSDITARADEGFGGNITINAKAVFFTDDIDLDASSNVAGRSGTVQIASPVSDISGDLVALPKQLLDAEALLPASCATRSDGEESSFIITGHDGLPLKPDSLLPSW